MKDSLKNVYFGKYKIIHLIGQGGMGRVYKAWDENLKRFIALKILLQDASGTALKRFKLEAKILAKIDHPNIIKIYDAGEVNGVTYFTMQYLEAKPIDKYVKENNLSNIQIVRIVEKLCRIVHAAHKKEIIHRDLKPDNILINEREEVYVVDFGIAKAYSEDYGLTKSNEVIGTLAFMSPEQVKAQKEKISYTSDVYSLGIILHVLLCGETPYTKTNSYINLALEISRHDWKVSDRIETSPKIICEKATAKLPQNRYKTARDMAQDLKNYTLNRKIKPFRNIYRLRAMLYASILLSVVSIVLTSLKLFYDEKNHIVYKEDSVDTIFNFVYACEYAQAISAFEKEPRLRLSAELCKIIGEAYYFTGNIDKSVYFFEKAINFSDVASTTKAKSLYYIGLLNYIEKKYTLAITSLEKSIQLYNDDNQDKFSTTRLLGICFVHEEKYEQAWRNFSQINEIFQNDLEYLQYFATAAQKLGYQNNDQNLSTQSLSLIHKCIKLNSFDIRNYLLQGHIYFDLKQYQLSAFSFRKALEIDKSNIEALEAISVIPYFDSSMQSYCFHCIMASMDDLQEQARPDLFAKEFVKIEKLYQENYISWQILQKTSKKNNDFTSLLKYLESSQDDRVLKNIEKALLSLRYQENFENNVKHLLAKNESLNTKLFFQHLLDTAEKLKEKEQEFVHYYQIAHMYNHKVWDFSISEDDLFFYLKKQKNSAFIKFLSASAIINIYGFDRLLDIVYDNGSDLLTKAICTAILRKYHLYTEIDSLLAIASTELDVPQNEYSFICCLAVGNLYISDRVYYSHRQNLLNFCDSVSDPETIVESFLQKKLVDDDEKVRVIAACSLFSLFFIDQNYSKYQNCIDVMKNGMHSENITLQYYTHYYFWNSKSLRQNSLLHFELYRQGLQSKDPQIIKIIFCHLGLFRELEYKYEFIQQALESNDKSIRLYAIMSLCVQDPLGEKIDEILQNQKITSFERIITFLTSWYYIFDGFSKRPIAEILQLNFANIVKKRVTKNQDKYYQAIMVYVGFLSRVYFSEIDDELYHELQKDDKNILKNILYSIGKESPTDPTLKFISVYTAKSSGEVIRRNRVKEFLENSDIDVRKLAVSSSISLALNEESIDNILASISPKDIPEFRESIALGLYGFLQRKWVGSTPDYKNYRELHIRDSHFVNPPEYFDVTNFASAEAFLVKTKERSTQKFREYKKIVLKACELDPTAKDYIFTLALIQIIENDTMQATNTLKKIIKMDKTHILSLLKLAEICGNAAEKYEYLKKIESLAYNHAFLLQTVAEHYYEIKNYEDSKRVYQRLFLLSTFKHPEHYEFLPEVYEELGNNKYANFFSQNLKKILIRKKIVDIK